MKTQAQVVVIGGGAVGTSILYHLALAGVTDTLLLERNELAAGSTWHAAGNIPTYANNWLGMRVGNYAWRLYKDLGKTVGSPISYRHTGAFWTAHSTERMELFRHLAGVSRTAGFGLRTLSPTEMEAMHPYWHAGDCVIGGIFDPYEGDLDPSQLTQALAKGARERGARIARFTPVNGLARRRSGEWAVATAKGGVVAEVVVNAAGFQGGQVAAMAGFHLPVVTLEHQYLVTGPVPALREDPAVFPLVRDPDIGFYLRREGRSFLLGSYGHAGRLAWSGEPPHDFASQLLADRVDDMLEILGKTLVHVPLLADVGAQRFVNGPIPYAPDALPLVGPATGAANFYHATGVQVGITHAAAIGKAIAEWICEGETEWDMLAWDPRRFGDWADQRYAARRACELYELQYAIPFPHRILRSARPVQTTPLHGILEKRGAVMGQIAGWERAFWFDRKGAAAAIDARELSFHDEPWRAATRSECEVVRDGVGVMDHGGFTKYLLEGPGAGAFLSRVFCGRLPAVGRVRLGYMLTPKGRIWSEATIARLATGRFLLCGPTLADQRDFDWLHENLPSDGVSLQRGYRHDGALLLMGPKSRALLATQTDADLSREAQPWMSTSELVVAGVDVTALRVSFVGELGWELHVASRDLPDLYAAIQDAGQLLGLRDFGSYALNAMRIEKGYHGWGVDFGSEYTLFDAGLERFADLDRGDFIGRSAVALQQEVPPDWSFVGIEIEQKGPDALPGDPIVRQGECIGYVTSCSEGFRIGKLLALGYVRRGTLAMGEPCAVTVLGHKRAARRHSPHAYDPDNRRLRG